MDRHTDTSESSSDTCRRERPDRRQAVWRSFLYSLVKRRRKGDRRDDHYDNPAYVDVHGPYVFLVAMLIILFSVLDTFFTLELISHGSSELNPIMARLLEINAFWFFIPKYIVTGFCVFWLVAHKKFTFLGIKGRHLLLFGAVVYALLIS